MGLLALRGLHGGIGWWSDVCHPCLLQGAVMDCERRGSFMRLPAHGRLREPSGNRERLREKLRAGTARDCWQCDWVHYVRM